MLKNILEIHSIDMSRFILSPVFIPGPTTMMRFLMSLSIASFIVRVTDGTTDEIMPPLKSDISVIDKEKNFIGGMIIPGLRTSLDSLSGKASQLPFISLVPPKKVIGTNTIDCMKSGIIHSNAASIDGVIERIENELGEKCTVVSTGGVAKIIVPYCKRDIVIDDELLLKGLMIIYNKNKQ